MTLEATMIVVDNSEFTRNGDYTPTRFQAQMDAVNLIFSAKTQSNPENTVGLMAMAGDGPTVLCTPTADMGRMLAASHDTKVGGSLHLATGLQVAALALKHRQNKLQRQRIVAFVASPVAEATADLVKLAKRMKKNNIAVDFVNFGEESDNSDKLDKFIEAINSSDNSHLVTVPPGPSLLSDVITSSPIINEGGEASFTAAGSGSGTAEFDLGVDPNADPELALALRMSLDDERLRQEREQEARAKEEGQELPPVKEDEEAK